MDLINYRKLAFVLLLSSYTYLSSMEGGAIDNAAIASHQNLSIKDKVIKWVKEHKPQTAIIAALAIAGMATGGYFAIKHLTRYSLENLKDEERLKELLKNPSALRSVLKDPKALEIVLNDTNLVYVYLPPNIRNAKEPLTDENIEVAFEMVQSYGPILEAMQRFIEKRKNDLQSLVDKYKSSSDKEKKDLLPQIGKSILIPKDTPSYLVVEDGFKAAFNKYDESLNNITKALKELSDKKVFKSGFQETKNKFKSYNFDDSEILKRYLQTIEDSYRSPKLEFYLGYDKYQTNK